MKPRPSIARMRELLSYDPETGVLTWRSDRGPKKAGDQAGYMSAEGYLRVRVDQVKLYVHRVAWALYTGDWPAERLDHIDRNRANNRAANLREVDDLQSMHNVSCHRDSKTGVIGVCPSPTTGRWVAHKTLHGKTKTIGTFSTIEEASAARERVHEEVLRVVGLI